MEITALIVSDELSDLNRMIGWFPKGIKVKGVNNFSTIPAALESELPKLIVMRTRNYNDFFDAYEAIRTFPETAESHIIAITDTEMGDAIRENVVLSAARLMGSSATDGYMQKIICDTLGIHN